MCLICSGVQLYILLWFYLGFCTVSLVLTSEYTPVLFFSSLYYVAEHVSNYCKL